MAAATPQNALPQNQQRQQPLAASSAQPSSTSTPSAQEEALKKNTDCVYFLASPLTCKKGSDCEYRHSDFARVNPRDCWFWLNGNCLNPKCGFRHPPLDGLLGGQAAIVNAPSFPPQKIRTPGTHASHGPKTVPCVFFQQGQCLKGGMCLFLHGPSPTTSSKTPQFQGSKQNSEPPKPTKAFSTLEKCSQEKRIPQANVSKPVPDGSVAKLVHKVGTTAKTNSSSDMIVPQPTSFNFDASKSKAASISATRNGISAGRLHHLNQLHASDHHQLHNGKVSEEFRRESSPGFDVLVDDDLRASDDYYHDEVHFGREDSMAVYDGHPADYDPSTDTSFGHMQRPCPWDQHMTSSERMKGGTPKLLERRGYRKSASPENKVSDLRCRLSKQRKVDGLRSVVSHDVPLDNHNAERNFMSSSRKDLTRQHLKESSLSNRLRGRIKLPGRPSVSSDDCLDGQLDGRRNRKLSPDGSQVSSYQGTNRNIIKGRGSIDYDDGRNFRFGQTRRDMGAGRSDFAGPKSLAELKTVKTTENEEQYLLRKRKFEGDYLANDISFEGPKPLSEILKEKRGVAASSCGTIISSNSKEDNKINEIEETKTNGLDNKVSVGTQRGLASLDKDDSSKNASEGIDKTNLTHGQSSEGSLANEHEVEDGTIYSRMVDRQEHKGDKQRENEYEDQVYDEDYAYDGDEHADQEAEYMDDEEDGDDFAKKIGAVLS